MLFAKVGTPVKRTWIYCAQF